MADFQNKFLENIAIESNYSSRITSVPTGADALEKLKDNSFDLVITMMRIGEIGPFELAKTIKKDFPTYRCYCYLTFSLITLSGKSC
jgi:CheY-like chemotaxis protein